MKDPDEVLPPTRYFVLVALHENESGDCIPFPLLDDTPLHLRYSSAIEASVSGPLGMYHWSGSRGQITNRIQDRLVECVQLPSLQPPV